MKVLQIAKYPSIKGGSETVLFDTIRLLKEAKHEVVLFSTNLSEPIYSPTYSVPYFETNASIGDKIKQIGAFFYNKAASRKLEEVIEKETPDIAHIHLYLNSLSVSILPVLKKHNIPVVMTLHDYRQICPSYFLLDKDLKICEKCRNGNYLNCMFSKCSKGSFAESALLTMEMYFRRIFFETEKYVDRFICVSDFELKKHEEFNRKIYDKALAIYNPVKQTSFRKTQKGGYLLYFGRLSREKGLPTLLSSMRNLSDIKLKVAGSGDDRLKKDAPENVEFLGFQERTELEQLIGEAAFTIVPSEWFETFGLSCAESLAMGTPVIASDIGAIPEIIEHNKNGFLFKAGDVNDLTEKITQGMGMPEDEYLELCMTGYDSIKRFSENEYINKILSLYNDLADNCK